MRFALSCTVALSLATAAARSAEAPSFTKKPVAAKAGEKTEISFAVSAPTDVEVAVLSADGKVVRHLAAGALGGKNPPPEPLKPGLVQSLEWDGRDDFGKPASGGPFKLRARAGMTVRFGRLIGSSPYTGALENGAPCDGVAVDGDGTTYVKLGSFAGVHTFGQPWHLRKFDRAGNYVKTLLPYPPSTPPDKTPGFKLIDAGDGLLTPGHTSGLDVVLFRFGDNIHNKVVDGQIVFVDNESARLTFFKADGSNAVKVVPMRTAPDKLKWPAWLAPQVAFSPDGKYAYYSNVANTPYEKNIHPSKMDQQFPQGRVYRQDLAKPGSNPEKFYDLELPDYDKQKYWLPNAWNKKTAATGIAVDAKGNVFVCDLVSQEVVEVSPEGKKLGSVKAPWPEKVLVNSKTGDLYVVSCAVSDGYRPAAELLKVSGRGAEAKVAARLPLKAPLGQSVALDESGTVPALLVGGGEELIRVEDQGAKLAPAGEGFINRDKNAVRIASYGDVDAEAELIYVSGQGPIWRYNGETGEGGPAPIKACDLAVGPGGMIYAWGDTGKYFGPVVRYTRDYKPAPLAATGKHTYGSLCGRYGRGDSVAGMAVDGRGWVYATCGTNDSHVRVYDHDGKLVEYERKVADGKEQVPAIISHVLDIGGNLRVDLAGNLYVSELGLPRTKGFVPAKGFEKDPAYLQCNGTIHKFTPKGGEFKQAKEGWGTTDAIASYSSPLASFSGAWNSTQSCCHCTRPRFGLDPYGRLYIPNGVTFKVAIRDNADNEIAAFGGYGNFDAQGPKSSEPKPEIPLGWPNFACPSEKYIYLGDGLNHRVVRADRVYAAEESCEVK
jgi:DNA-binding beta-propeller fold protein YncE